jgi:hypothetical protein
VTPLNKNFSGPLIAPSVSAPAGADSTVSCSFIWSSEKYPLFDGKLSRPIFFFGVPTHDLLANDDGSELCSCVGPRSPTGTIASRKTRGAPRRRGRISLFIRECLPVARSRGRQCNANRTGAALYSSLVDRTPHSRWEQLSSAHLPSRKGI